MRKQLQLYHKKIVLVALLACFVFVVSSCGKTAFNVAPTTENLTAAGTFSTPPKVDIVLIMDDTGSMFQAYPEVSQQFNQFLSGLDGLKFNYHATVVPMTSTWTVQQVAGSKYDISNPSFTPAYPGDKGLGIGMITSSFFKTAANYSSYVTQSNMSTTSNGMENTFQNILSMTATGFQGTGFFRSDATPVFVFMGNGNDTSGVNFCQRPVDNVLVPCEEISGSTPCVPTAADPIAGGSKTCGSQATSMSYYQTQFQTAHPGLKVYSMVANQAVASCLGAKSYVGARYEQLASNTGGQSFDLCAGATSSSSASTIVSSVLSHMTSYLQSQVQAYQVQYVMINPTQAPTQVTVLVGGNVSNAVVVPQDSTQPLYWTYAGNVTNVATLLAIGPNNTQIRLNTESGNAIQFHTNPGGALPTGNDTIQVQEMAPGATNSVSQ